MPNKALYRPEEEVVLQVRLADGRPLAGWSYEYEVWDLNERLAEGRGKWTAGDGSETVVRLGAVRDGSGAYGAFVALTGPDGERLTAETAFDSAAHWREAPRYGFLSDFAPEEGGRLDDVEFLNRHHINLVQFYDWMYRHDRLLPDTDEFVDPLGRRLSLGVVRRKIAALRERGIASIAYAAVYGSLPDYIQKHPEQGLYQNDGKTHSLGGYFHIMDISGDSAWTAHLYRELEGVLERMGFDGFHLDQYGFPKKAIRKRGDGVREVVRLKELYPKFINGLRERLSGAFPEAGLIFNNVSNYPVQTTAGAAQDIVYIEVWDPVTHLRDLKQLIDWARMLSGKQVVLAAYLPAFHPEKGVSPDEAEIGARLTMSSIFASGGYHLLLGEHENVLADSYYPKYGTVSDRFKANLTTLYDFIVMYRNLLFDLELDDVSMTFAGGINTEIVATKAGVTFAPNGHPGAVWTIVKEKPGYLVVHLINLSGVDNDVWHEGKRNPPAVQEGIEVRAEVWEQVTDVYWASPDGDGIRPETLAYEWVRKDENSGYVVRTTVPRLEYWSMLVIETKAGVPAEID